MMINALTSFRFFAALMVFVWHINILKKYDFGYMGVSFFFVLSGFILAYNYHNRLENLRSGILTSFYIARFAKIYPVHLLMLCISIPHTILDEQRFHLGHIYQRAVANIFLVQSYIPKVEYYFTFNAVSWSLSNEVFFYLFFP